MACSDSDYAYLRGLVMEQSANRIDPSRNALFDTRLTPIARLSGAANLEDFVHMLKAGRPAHLHRAVAEAMTVNESSFFRDPALFEVLREKVLPRLLAARGADKRLRIWSAAAACSATRTRVSRRSRASPHRAPARSLRRKRPSGHASVAPMAAGSAGAARST